MTPDTLTLLPFSAPTDDDAALLAYLRQLEQDERIREYSEEC